MYDIISFALIIIVILIFFYILNKAIDYFMLKRLKRRYNGEKDSGRRFEKDKLFPRTRDGRDREYERGYRRRDGRDGRYEREEESYDEEEYPRRDYRGYERDEREYRDRRYENEEPRISKHDVSRDYNVERSRTESIGDNNRYEKDQRDIEYDRGYDRRSPRNTSKEFKRRFR